MYRLNDKCEIFLDQIAHLEAYEEKSFVTKLFTSKKVDENQLVVNLNEFLSSHFIDEISNLIDDYSFKSSFEWFSAVKDYLYPENIYKILDEYGNLEFLNNEILSMVANYKQSVEMKIRASEKLDNMLNKYI